MNNQNQTSFTRSEIEALLADTDAPRGSEFCPFERLQAVLERNHLTELADHLELETQAANAFGAPPAQFRWGFVRLPATTPLGVRCGKVEILTGARLTTCVRLDALRYNEVLASGQLESFVEELDLTGAPWNIECREDEVIVLAASYSPSEEEDSDPDGSVYRAELEAFEESIQHLDEAARDRAHVVRISEENEARARRDLALLPVHAISLVASEDQTAVIAAAAVEYVSGVADDILENPTKNPFVQTSATLPLLDPSADTSSLLQEVLELDRPGTRRARAALSAALEAARAARAAHAALRRCQAQQILDHLGLGSIHHVDPVRLAGLADRELVRLAQALIRAYPSASLRGGFYYLTGKSAEFDAFWEQFRASHDPLVARLEYWTELRGSSESEEWAPDGPVLTEVDLDDLTAILTEGIVAVVEMSLRPETKSQDLSRSLSLSVGGKSFLEEILTFTSADVEADREIAADTERTPRERAEATLRLAGFLANDVQGGPAGEDSPFLTSRTHLLILRHLPPVLRIALIRPGGEHQTTWRKMLSVAVNGPLPE